MKKTILLATLAFIMFGCTSMRLSQLEKPDGQYSAQILASAKLDFASDRAAALKNIAAKEGLSEAEQLYLVDVVRAARLFRSDTKQVLLALIENPSTTEMTRNRISESLPKFGLFSSDEKDVLDAIIE